MTGNGIGSAFENEICVALSMWATNARRRDVFWRSSGSGGMAELRSRGASKATVGDVAATDPRGRQFTDRVFVGCNYSTDLRHLEWFYERARPLGPVWDVRHEQAQAAGKQLLVVLKEGRRPPMCLATPSLFFDLYRSADGDLRRSGTVARGDAEVSVFRFHDLLVECDYGRLVKPWQPPETP